jgi:hypothetical protein
MSLTTGRAKLIGSLKDLMVKWEKARESWSDPVSEDMEKTVLAPLEPKVRAAATAMEKMGEILARARRECE